MIDWVEGIICRLKKKVWQKNGRSERMIDREKPKELKSDRTREG